MKASPLLAALAYALSVLAKSNVGNSTSPRCTPSIFSNPNVGSNVEILSITATQQNNFTSATGGALLPALKGLSFCQVQVYLTHKGTDDKVLVEVWLPPAQDDWNGRFLATGGGGFATGSFSAELGVALDNGWAAVSTDGGHMPIIGDGSWALNKDRSINWNLLNNFATRSLVEQILVGKSITEQYFGKKPHHSYWKGCSTGGRQGYAIAQKYPHLLDGILAIAPAISFAHFVTGEFHPQLMMKILDTYMSSCELDYFRWKAIEQCDGLDGLLDGVIDQPEACAFDPQTIVGDTIQCDGTEVKITNPMAQLVSAIQEGFSTSNGVKVWPGLAPGTRMDRLAGINTSETGVRSQNPFPITASWLKNIVLKDPSFNLSTIDMAQFVELFAQASYEYGGLINADNPDLSFLQASGTKLLTWHGASDELIPFQNTLAYRKRVEGAMGGAQAVNDYYRLFLAPGVEHCGGGMGPAPTDPLTALVAWAEDKEPPETLDAEIMNENGELVTRELCAWPGQSKYMGVGDAKRASSWSCVGGTEKPEGDVMDEPNEEFKTQLLGCSEGTIAGQKKKSKRVMEEELGKGRAGQVLGGLKNRWEGLGIGLAIG